MDDLVTPADVHAVAFRKSPLGKRGYDEEQVDLFLDRVERTLTALAAEITSLRAGAQGQGDVQARSTASGLQEAVLAELDLIKVRLARIETAVAGGGNRAVLTDPMGGTL
jgi:DivIVA domain-containing protein